MESKAQETARLISGAHDTMCSIASVLRSVPMVEQPALVRILRYELERHEALVEELPDCVVDEGLTDALHWVHELIDLEFGAPRFVKVLERLQIALAHHIEVEESRLRLLTRGMAPSN